MRFSFIDAKKAEFPFARLCETLEVSQSGYFAWKSRPASERQCKEMVLLAHIRERFRLSRETYGSPRMHADLTEDGIIAVVGWAVRDRLKKDLALSALQRALILRQPKTGILHYSDRGSQYCSYDY
jgi:putative transposase